MSKYRVTFVTHYIVDSSDINPEDFRDSAIEAVMAGADESWSETVEIVELGLQ